MITLTLIRPFWFADNGSKIKLLANNKEVATVLPQSKLVLSLPPGDYTLQLSSRFFTSKPTQVALKNDETLYLKTRKLLILLPFSPAIAAAIASQFALNNLQWLLLMATVVLFVYGFYYLPFSKPFLYIKHKNS